MIHPGDCLTVLRAQFADESVQCCVTSPPYWGLRDYGCEGQLGLEETPELYVAKMVEVFREVKRVLKADGTLWLNLGDSYASTPPGNTTKGVSGKSTLNGVNGSSGAYRETLSQSVQTKRSTIVGSLKPKDLVGIPWRVAFALQADGWYLRSDIIWAKPNPMPESVTDRPTKSHEYLFLLSKSERYYYDWEAIKEKGCDDVGTHRGGSLLKAAAGVKGDPKVQWHNHGGGIESLLATGFRNKRTVWTVATTPFSGARLMRGAVGGSDHTKKSNCPVHGDGVRMGSKGQDDAQQDASLSVRNHGNNSHHAQARSDERVPIQMLHDEDSALDSLDSQDHEYELTASEHSKEIHRTDHAPSILPHEKGDDELLSRIGDKQQARDSTSTFAHTDESKTEEDSASNVSDHAEQTDRNNAHKCTCGHDSTISDHFAVFPPKLIEPCILAGCPSGGLVLDPFAGSGTTIQVAQQLGRQGVGIELNPAYIALADTRTAQTGLAL